MAQQRVLNVGESTWHFIDTLRALVSREFRIRYKGSFFGILWAVLNPLATVAVLWFLFTKVLKVGVPHFPVFLYSAILSWVWFSTSVQTSASTLMDNRALVRTPFFSKPLLPWAVTCTNFVLYVMALPVLFGLMAFDGVPLTAALAVLPVIWLVQWLLTLAFTVLIAAIGILVRDVQHLIGVILLFWFYLTPIFYDLKQVPPDIARWYVYNPMIPIITAHRAVTVNGVLPDWASLGKVTVVGAVLLAVSLLLFRTLEDAFIDEA
jgi:homopolymeric O-antigen transport system permease protein